jgi:hypothetical protein
MILVEFHHHHHHHLQYMKTDLKIKSKSPKSDFLNRDLKSAKYGSQCITCIEGFFSDFRGQIFCFVGFNLFNFISKFYPNAKFFNRDLTTILGRRSVIKAT